MKITGVGSGCLWRRADASDMSSAMLGTAAWCGCEGGASCTRL